MRSSVNSFVVLLFNLLQNNAPVIDRCPPSCPYEVKVFNQTLDHFNFVSQGDNTFKQRYLTQDKWWDRNNNGPIFFYTGNEGAITSFWDNSGFVFESAIKFKALVVFAEHRYYGSSLPFGRDSFKHANVGLLTVEQALADYAVLIDFLKTTLKAKNSPVIVFGGSYGGMLSAYMRFKYPNLVDGAIAASAPMLLVGGGVSRDFFFQDITKDFKSASTDCYSRVKQGFVDMNALFKTGLRDLSIIFHLCQPISTLEQYRHLLGWIRNAFTYLAMLDYPYPTSFSGNLPGNPVKVACQLIHSAYSAMEGLRQASALYYNDSSSPLPCFDIFKDFIECSDPTGCGLGFEGTAWDYQACTEMLMPAGSNNQTDMFPNLPFTEQMRQEYCQKTWGVTPRKNWFRINFWGDNIKSSSNIVFSNGDLDPWHRGGVTQNLSDSLIAIVIKGGAHHLDLRASNKLDPPSVRKARFTEQYYIQQWITEKKQTK